MSDSDSERKLGTPGLGTPDTINAVVIVDGESGQAFEYRGPYSFRRDGGCWETDIPIGLYERGGIDNATADRLGERVGDVALAYADSNVHSSGVIEAADVIDGKLTIRVDDPAHLSSDDVDVDPSEVDR
ncbi:hypothetical protein [Natronorubrum sp. FCH18a]|uniref:hypothetical protein n=1 Tax=Natronorubrum sp. FCH18a TaxID=3447018 RepID=UPI003F510EE0